MRKSFVSMVVGVFAAMVLLLAPGRSPVTVTAQPAVDLAGEWGIVYAEGTATFGECTFGESQTIGGVLSSTKAMTCKANEIPTATGGVITGTVSGYTVNGQVAFTWPTGDTAYFSGTASGDGNAQQGNWGITPTPLPYTYIGSRLVTTPPGSAQTVTVVSGGTTYTATFGSVNVTGGTTVVSDSSTSGTLPEQFELCGDLYLHVITTAGYSGDITFCTSYEETGDTNGRNGTIPACGGLAETQLQLWHYEGTNWVDRTDPDGSGTTNYNSNILCATVSSLSEFALVAPKSVGGIAELPAAAVEPDSSAVAADGSGSSAPLYAAIGGGAALLVIVLGGAGWYTRRRWLR